MDILIYIVFILTYLLISSRRLSLLPIGRPAGALVGAFLMVAIGALTPVESYASIDYDTIVLLFGTMVLTVYMESAGFFQMLACRVIYFSGTPRRLLMAVSLVSGFLSALMVNDTVCLFLTPVIISACVNSGLPLGPYLMALATSANIGSAATLVGNPQNMIIGSLSGFSFTEFLFIAGPASAAGLLINMCLLSLFYNRKLPAGRLKLQAVSIEYDKGRLTTVIIVTVSVIFGFFAGFHLGFTALAGVVALILIGGKDPRDVFSRIDWALLLFFCCLFIVVAGLAKSGIIERIWNLSSSHISLSRPSGLIIFSTIMTLGSNLISNVPMVLMTGPYLEGLGSAPLGWVLLAFITTVAGNFTLIGSVANIIVAERARDAYSLGFFEYCRFGAVSTILVLFSGVAVINLIMK
ncbi:MAG: anion transporter [Deltaproteobacteria bacterium]|nr:anion transporter [Deltaproteobacteria bacterium]